LENLVADVLADHGLETVNPDTPENPNIGDPQILKKKYLDNNDPFGSKGFVKAPVHCECALIYHLNKPATNIPPVGYLGVSKLSCSACKIFIDVWNQNNTRGRKFLTRGCHGKYYFPWALPPSLDQKTATAFVASITDYIAKSLKEAGVVRSRRLGESTCPSSDSSDDNPPVILAPGDDPETDLRNFDQEWESMW
jgi:hypothetical protein